MTFHRFRSLLGAALLGLCGTAGAATHVYTVLLDTDRNAATGCSVATSKGSFAGAEQSLTTTVTTTANTAVVTSVQRRTCNAGAFGPPTVMAGGWPVAMSGGSSGTAAIETAVARSALGNTLGVRLGVVSQAQDGATDAIVPANLAFAFATAPSAPPAAIPALAPAGLAAMVALLALFGGRAARRFSGVARVAAFVCLAGIAHLALGVVLDGALNDWTGVQPLATSAKGDAPPNADLVAMYAQADSVNLYLRIDADVRFDVPGNQPPVVNAGAAQTVVLPASAGLTGTASDDGLPVPPGRITTTWTKLSGPGTVSFGHPEALVTTASFSVAGTYVLRLAADDGATTTTSDVVITVDAIITGNTPPIVSAGASQSLPAPGTAALAGSATDDGLPQPPATLTYLWSQDSGPIPALVADPTRAATDVTFVQPGTYVLRLTAHDGAAGASATTQIVVADAAPTLASLPDRTIALGTTFQARLAANDANVGDALTFFLDAAPNGARFNPNPEIEWTPTAAQVGVNTFTARVADSRGHSDTRTFHVTVIAANRPPQLAPQDDVSVLAGSVFSRALAASDPDAGDVLTFALVSGPTGMQLVGNTLQWNPVTVAPGDYFATVKVADTAGAIDAKRFKLTVGSASKPAARDDTYETTLGASLSVAAAGVLQNDWDPDGGSLAAVKLTDPDKGSVSSFNADGSFVYVAPAAPPGPVLDVQRTAEYGGGSVDIGGYPMLVADLDADGKPELIWWDGDQLHATTVATGVELMFVGGGDGILKDGVNPVLSDTGHTCALYGRGASIFAVGDIDDSGRPSIVMGAQCSQDAGPFYAIDNAGRVLALAYDPDPANASHYIVKWITPMLTPPGTPPVAAFTTYSIARLAPDQSPSVLLGRSIEDHSNATCSNVIGVAVRGCRIVWALDGQTGAVRKTYTSFPDDPASISGYASATILGSGSFMGPVVADVDNDGVLDILYEGTLWSVAGTVKRQFDGTAATGRATMSSVVVDLDGDAQMEIVTLDGVGGSGPGWIKAWKPNGTLLWSLPVPRTTLVTKLAVADVDRDGKPDILVGIFSSLWVIDAAGQIKWIKDLTGSAEGHNFQFFSGSVSFPVYDLNGDGVPEIIVQYGKQTIRFLRGDTGEDQIRYDYPNTNYENTQSRMNPVVADLTGTGHAGIAWYHDVNLNGTSFVQVLHGNTQPWVAAPAQYNQHAYWGTNFDAHGTVPSTYTRHTTDPRTNLFGNQPQAPYASSFTPPGVTSFTYRASNAALASDPASVTIRLVPPNRPPRFTSRAPTYWASFSMDYFAHAVDPDPADTITYAKVFQEGNNPAITVNPTTGQVHIDAMFAGEQVIMISATDNHGAVGYQSIVMQQASGTTNVPDVVTMTQPAATAALGSAQLALGPVTLQSHSAPSGTVLSQSPAAGTVLPRGEAVYLTISSGPAPVPVPSVTGKARTAATTTLSAAGFTVTTVASFSSTVPAGIVLLQSPAAGTLVAPIPPNPVTLTVSAGNGLALALNRSVTTADQAITVMPSAFDVNGDPAAVPALTYVITARQTPFSGALPTVSGTTIVPGAATLGAFTITATDTANGRSATAEFAVLPRRVAGLASNGEAFAHLLEVLDGIQALREPLEAARRANDLPLMKSLLQQVVVLWRTVDLDRLRIAQPLVTADQFPPTIAMLDALGLAPTPDDVLARAVLRDSLTDLRAWTKGLGTDGLTLAQLDALADQFSTRAARMDGLLISRYGGIANASLYAALVSHEIPAFYEALTAELAILTGLPPRDASFPQAKARALHGLASPKASLAELAVTTAVDYMVEKVSEQASKLYKNARQYTVDILSQAAYTAAAVAAANELRAFVQGQDVVEVVSGASLSFREFQAAPAWIEVPADPEPNVNVVLAIGPDLFSKSVQGGTNFVKKLQDGYNKNLNPNTNPSRFRNPDEVYDALSRFLSVAEQGLNDVDGLVAQQSRLVFQSADRALAGCVFTSDPACRQLVYDDGILPVYTYAPPPGFTSLGGLPVPIVFIVYNAADGTMYFGNPAFLPCAPVGKKVQCPNNPPFTP